MVIEVLFENDDLVAVNKPEGISTIRERHGGGEDLATVLSEQEGKRLWTVHRLDKSVSGVILFTKTAEMHRYLNRQFEQRKVKKTYAALVHGACKTLSGKIDAPLRQFGSGRMGVDPQRGKSSCTEYEVTHTGHNYSLLRVFPVTGRRHQIRVHLYHLGHTIVGDPLYGDSEQQAGYSRLMLHAERIALTSPDGQPISIESPFSASFQTILAELCDR